MGILGDDITIVSAKGVETKIKALFEWDYDEAFIEDRTHDTHPELQEILRKDVHLFDDYESVIVKYNDREFSVAEFYHVHDRNSKAILRVKRIG